jgi:hypothetical protein
MLTAESERLVFDPVSGFHSARVLQTSTNFVVRRGDATFTAAVVSDRDLTSVHLTVIGFPEPPGMEGAKAWRRLDERATVRDERGREIAPHPRWQTGGTIYRRSDGMLMLNWELRLERLAPEVRAVVVSFGGAAGAWDERIPLEEIEMAGVPAQAVSAADSIDGITIAASAVARSPEMTAIEIGAEVDDRTARRHVTGIAASGLGGMRMQDEPLVLRDGSGRMYREIVGSPAEHQRPNRNVLRFPRLLGDVDTATLEIPFVQTQERTDETFALPVPGEIDVAIVGCLARVRTMRVDERGPRIRIDVTPVDGDAHRQLSHFSGAFVEGESELGMSLVHCPGAPPYLTARDPSGASTAITVRGPVVRIGGPWRLDMAIPRSG